MQNGVLLALGAYLCWGLFPIYFRALASISPVEVLAHRVVWSTCTVAILLVLLRRTAWIGVALARPLTLRRYVLSSAFICLNWLLYIWAVNTGHVVDASLGYFISPLVNVLLGTLLLKERMRRWQKVAVVVASLGVAWLTWQAGAPPWIALGLAGSFSLYGLLRRSAALGALEGFSAEVALLAPLAVAYLAWRAAQGTLGFSSASESDQWLLIAAGPVTTLPLLLYAAGARRITFSLLGLLQFVTPTLQWLCGVLLFLEPFEASKALGFALIWLALVVFAGESAWAGWRQSR